MDIVDIPPLPKHEDLARRARVLFKATREGEPEYPHVRTSYVFFSPSEQIKKSHGSEMIEVPFADRFVEVPISDVKKVLREARRDRHEKLVTLPETFDPTGKVCTIGVCIW